MAYSHVQPYVRNGIGGWFVCWRLPSDDPLTRTKSNHVSSKRFPIADGVTAEQAWEEAFKFASRIYSEGFLEVPPMPDVDWKALGATATTTYTHRYKKKTERAFELFKTGYDVTRIATELGVSERSVFRWRKAWNEQCSGRSSKAS